MQRKNRIHPLKYLGQNYLIDHNIIKKIVDELNPVHDDQIIEIGPGKGSITKELINRLERLIVVEIDKRVIEDLKKISGKIIILHEDILNIDFNSFAGNGDRKFRVIGNIPFNLTAPIIFKLIRSRTVVGDAVFLVQNEVAKRIAAPKSTKDYGILSVLLKYFGESKYCFKVSPNVFYPKPKVETAVIHISFNKKTSSDISDELFINTVKAAFGNRRKTLKNSLGNSIFKNSNFGSFDFDLSKRAEELDVEDFVKLAVFIKSQTNDK